MNDFKIKIADIVFSVECLYPTTKWYCKDYIDSSEARYHIAITEEDVYREREKETKPHVFSDNYFELLALYRKIVEIAIDENVLLFHSSVIMLDGFSYVFAGSSGTGKSTHVRLWREAMAEKNAIMINDDKPLFKVDEGIAAYGTPWDGKERLSKNISAPIKGICFLHQGEKNSIRLMEKKNILPNLIKQTYRSSNKEKMMKTIQLLTRIADSVPVYEMYCTISKEAALLSYNCMSKGNLK